MLMSQIFDYTLVICTYNPDERILKRCLEAVKNLDRTGLITETILVDNNSKIAVESLPYVKYYAGIIPAMKILFVEQQGVQFARMAAIEQAKGKYIVYFDSDNEPVNDYLQVLKLLNQQYGHVAAWGPGNVTVDFIDGIDPLIKQYAKASFQERHDLEIAFANEPEWQPCYPFGTGLCTNAFLLKEYVTLARKGIFTFQGREGRKLSSGEDTQMVLLCIKKGFDAGVAPALKLTHMIPADRANRAYLNRLIYGTYVCYETCSLQVFPGRQAALNKKIMPGIKFTIQSIKKTLKARWSSNPHKLFNAIKFIAAEAGIYMAVQRPLPPVVQRIIKSLKVE